MYTHRSMTRRTRIEYTATHTISEAQPRLSSTTCSLMAGSPWGRKFSPSSVTAAFVAGEATERHVDPSPCFSRAWEVGLRLGLGKRPFDRLGGALLYGSNQEITRLRAPPLP